MSVYEFVDEQAAQQFADATSRVDPRVAGRFVLIFIPGGSSTQQFTSAEARDAFAGSWMTACSPQSGRSDMDLRRPPAQDQA